MFSCFFVFLYDRILFKNNFFLFGGNIFKKIIIVNQIILVSADGELSISNHAEMVGDVTYLPKVGMQMHLPKQYDKLRFFGKDAENYPDRNAAGVFGVYTSNALDNFEQHVVP